MWLSDVDAYRATLSENSQSRDFNATPVFPDLEGIAFPYIPRKVMLYWLIVAFYSND